jgi:3-oxoadipate enol-lactonase
VIFERDGVALNFRDEGRGPAVALLHGHTLDLRMWDDLTAVLTHRGFRVIRYDQRGQGRSASPPSGYRWGDHAADLAGLLEARHAAPAHLVGLSKGGGIALELAVRRPELVRSLVVVGPLVPDFPLSAELRAELRELGQRIRSAGVQQAVRDLWLDGPLFASAHAIPGVREKLESMVLTFPAGEYFAAGRDAPDREWRVPDRLVEITAPTLAVAGEHDVPDFASMAALAATRIPGARLEVVAGCGHLVPLERSRQFIDLVVAFLRGDAVNASRAEEEVGHQR